MITEIEMLKKRVHYLESTLIRELDLETDHQKNYNLIWNELHEEINTYKEQYRKNVSRIGCRECQE